MALVLNGVMASPYGKGVLGGFGQPTSCGSGVGTTSGTSLTGVGALLPGLLGACGDERQKPACTQTSDCTPSQAIDVCDPGEVSNYWTLDRTSLGTSDCTPTTACSKPSNCGNTGGSNPSGSDPGQLVPN